MMSVFADCTRDECIQLVVDFIDVSIHQILWSQKVYPKEIFQSTQKFNSLVYKSIHPEVNNYINCTLSSLKLLLLEGFVERLVVVIKDDTPIHKFVFSFDSYYRATSSGKITMNLTEIKHQARAIWLTISQKFNSDIDQKENCTFTFEIHTRNVEYDKILERQSTEEFQWIKAGKPMNPNSIASIWKLDSQPFSIDIYAENYR